MATPNVGILTTAGKALIAKVNSGQAKISFSKVVFSSMDNSQLSDTQVKALTAISPQEVVVSPPETTLDTTSGETRIRATGTNEKLADGVYVKTYGVFAKDDTGNEILYGVTVSPNPNYFPAYDGVTPQAVTYSYKTVIQETRNITMTNSNDVYVSQEDLTEAIEKIPQPDLSNYATQQQLAIKADNSKVVHTADMRKPANQVAGMDDVNAKQDKLTYTAANDATSFHRDATGTVNESGNFPGLQVEGVDVATAADLKSIEDASWHTITGKSESLSSYKCMYKINNIQNYVDLFLYGIMGISIDNNDTSMYEVMDLSMIISNPKKVSGKLIVPTQESGGGGVAQNLAISGTKLVFNWQYVDHILYAGKNLISCGSGIDIPFLRLNFD